ncbi:MAG TPA: ParB N-terminal domain-containing protein [Candidatus Binatia bacterium]|nr:ParB N-terminal domain-containing protein [Candidatus Binatia bacterium]
MAEKTAKKKSGSRTKRRKLAGKSTGLMPNELAGTAPPAIESLQRAVEEDGGRVISSYREPFGGQWLIMASLPIRQVEPTPYQRNLSDTHVRKLETVIAKLGRFLDPIIVVRGEPNQDGVRYWTPNGNHRLSALRTLGAKSVTAIVVPETSTAYKILALNTEKSHNLRERALEVIKMYQELATLDEAAEDTYALEFEDAALITLGLCYLEQGRFSGGAYHPILRRVDGFIKKPLQAALEIRRERSKMLMDLDKKVCERVDTLKKRGLTSPYLKSFVVARINPIRFRPKDAAPLSYNEVLERMIKAVDRFNPEKIRMEDLAKSGGAPED